MNEDTKAMRLSLEAKVKELEKLLEDKTMQRRIIREIIQMEKKTPDKDREAIKQLELDSHNRRFELFRLDDQLKNAKKEYDKFMFIENCRQRQNTPGTKRVQLTMNAFISVKTPSGKVEPKCGPKVLQDDSDLNCYPCFRTFRSIEGRREHQRHCYRYLSENHGLPKDEEHWLNKKLKAAASETISPSTASTDTANDAESSKSISIDSTFPANVNDNETANFSNNAQNSVSGSQSAH